MEPWLCVELLLRCHRVLKETMTVSYEVGAAAKQPQERIRELIVDSWSVQYIRSSGCHWLGCQAGIFQSLPLLY